MVKVSRKFTKDRCGWFIRYFLAVGTYKYYVRDIIKYAVTLIHSIFFQEHPGERKDILANTPK